MRIVCEERMVPCANAIAPAATITWIVERRRTRAPTSTTLATLTRSTKNRPASMATAVPDQPEIAAKGNIHTVMRGGWINAKSR